MFLDEVTKMITGLMTDRTQAAILIFIIAGYIYFFFLRIKYDVRIKDLKEIDVLIISLMFSLLTFLIALPFVVSFYMYQMLIDTLTYIINYSILFQILFIFLLYEFILLKHKRRKMIREKIFYWFFSSKLIEGIFLIVFFISIMIIAIPNLQTWVNITKPSWFSIIFMLPISFGFFKLTIKLTEKILEI